MNEMGRRPTISISTHYARLPRRSLRRSLSEGVDSSDGHLPARLHRLWRSHCGQAITALKALQADGVIAVAI